MKSLKGAPSLPVLKTAAEDIFVGDNIAVRRLIFGNGNVQKSEEICIATVIEVKTVQSKGVAQSLRNLNVGLQQDREREYQEKQERSLSTERNTEEYSEGHKRLRSEEPIQIQLHDEPENASTELKYSTSLPEIKAGSLSEDKSRESSCDDTSTKQIYYVHYNGMDRRLDEWIDKSRIVEEEGEYIATLTPVDKNKTLTRSQRRFQEEFHHLQKSYDDMDATTAKLEREHEERTKVKNVELIQFGEYEIDAWYFSPFPLPVTINNSKVFFCEYCLWYTVDQEKYICHIVHSCKERKPPGDEVYYHNNLAVYEVSGHECKTYCQSLCLLSKLFLDHKTLYYDVESFMFYVLCEMDEHGAHLVGHFSKEVNSANNLACIMVLPPFQRNGYGKLLIQMSYCLSEREGVIGTPERPLSDLGKVSYRSYWWWVLLAVLEERRVDENISVGDLSRLSGIHVDDIIYTFNTLQLVRYWKGDHVVRASRKIVYHCKRLQLFHPPKLILNTSAVKWQPKTTDLMNYWSIHLENETCAGKYSALQTPDSSRTDATLKKWKSLLPGSENLTLQNIVKFNDALYAISDGKLVEWESNSGAFNAIDTESVLGSNETIVNLVSRFDLLLSLDSLGNVFIASPQNVTDLNGKSDEITEKSIQFVKIELVQGQTRCVHGVNCTPERRISAKDISCTRVGVYIVDQLGNVWTFKREGQQSFTHEFGTSRRVEVSKVPFPEYKIVRNVFCGSGHCIALVDNNQSLNIAREGEMETNPQNKTCLEVENSSLSCEKCVEEGNNRLSFLMESANEVPSTSSSSTPRERGGNADSNSPVTSRSLAPTSRPSPRSTQNSPAPSPAQNAVVARLEGLRTWNFRRGAKCPKESVALAKSSKLGQKSITHSQKTASLGQSSSSWRKQQRLAKHNSLDIELSTLTISSRSQNDSEKQSSQNISTDLTGSIQFSFVSLDNVLASSTDDSGSTAATISDSDLAYSSPSLSVQSTSCLLQPSPNQTIKKHTSPTMCDDRSNEILIVKNYAENMRLTNISNVEQFSELWSWGDNQSGQLGLSDTVARKEPQKIRLLPNGPISKVCCGDNHNIVLMTTGEAYVWGSNANGQFKQINYQYFSQPTLLKLGSESSILDVAASGNTTSVIVANPVTNGSTESHTVFHFSKVHSEADDSPTIQINDYSSDNQNDTEESPQLPLNLYSLSGGSRLVLSSRPNLNNPISSNSEISSSNLMKMIKTTKVSVNLLGLLDRILEQNQYPSSETSIPPSVETLLHLLGDLRSALLEWSLTLSHITQTMFHILKTNPEKAQISQSLTFSAVMRILVRLHLAYVDAVGYGCFFDVDIGPELESYIERLSLDYEAESSKQYRRLRNLFNVPFKNFSGIRHVMASVLVSFLLIFRDRLWFEIKLIEVIID